jgi:flagellar hook protein FlgE
MFDSIFIGTSGLISHEKGLRAVSNNLANVNTPGYKSSQLQFADLFDKNGGDSNNSATTSNAVGTGLSTHGLKISFKAGLDQATGNPLDLNINGNGFYAVRRDGNILYTRSGDFHIDAKGILVNASGDHVLALDRGGQLVDVNVESFAHSLPKATANVIFNGNLTSTIQTPVVNTTVNGVNIIDPNGGTHSVNLSFKDNGGGDYTVTISDPTGTSLGTGTIKFASGFAVPGSNAVSFSYTPPGFAAFNVNLDFSQNVTSLLDPSTISVASQDGHVAGVKSDQSIDPDGTVVIKYSNGETAKGPRLALASFKTDGDLEQAGGASFTKKDGVTVQYGYAGTETFGTLQAGHREGSNVDLAEEFSNLILMQRGYQAASHVISTANDMIQELFDMKGHR